MFFFFPSQQWNFYPVQTSVQLQKYIYVYKYISYILFHGSVCITVLESRFRYV